MQSHKVAIMIFAAATLLLMSLFSVSADDATTTTRRDAAARVKAQERIQVHERADDIRARFKAAKQERETKLKMARDNFQAKLKQMKDEKKKKTAEALYNRLEALNAKWTEHFSSVLSKLDEILEKIVSRRDKAQAADKDIAAVNTAIDAARAAIATARTAVEAQAKKTYAVSVTTEIRLREAFQAAHAAAKKDVFDLRDGAMKTARASVQNTIRALRGIGGVDEKHNATSSPR